jgi:hypothetical protein
MQTIITDDEYHSIGFSLGEIVGILDGDRRYGLITYNYHVDGLKVVGVF